MAHEKSVTKQRGDKWINVTGPDVVSTSGASPPDTVLQPLFPYEKESYETEPEASAAAERRSEDFGKEVDKSMRRHRQAEQMMAPGGGVFEPWNEKKPADPYAHIDPIVRDK